MFSNTLPCKDASNMAVPSMITYKIGLIWRHMKTLYWKFILLILNICFNISLLYKFLQYVLVEVLMETGKYMNMQIYRKRNLGYLARCFTREHELEMSVK